MADDDVKRLLDTVHSLLRGPDGQGQYDDSYEKERIVLDIPKAWVVLAAWLALKERKRSAGKPHDSAFMWPDDPARVDKHIRTWARGYLWRVIDNQMHTELHELAVSAHPLLLPEKEEKAGPDMDDDLPF